jgi:hypothetical protein
MFYFQHVHFLFLDFMSSWSLYIYIYSQGFIWILFWNMQRCKLIILLSSSNLVIVVFFEYWFSNSWVLVLDVQFDDNSSSTSNLVEI